MLPIDLKREIKTRLKTLNGQIEGLVKMLDEEREPEMFLQQFKAVDKGFQKAYYILLDEIFRKELALKLVEVMNSCPGNCQDADKIEYLRQEFPKLEMDQIIKKMKEIDEIKTRLKDII